MTELKTLKGITTFTAGMVNPKDVRQAAIEWAKHFNVKFKEAPIEENAAPLRWIMHFFNLTEEDLE